MTFEYFLGKIIPNSPADLCGQLQVNDRILAVNDVDITHMPHTDVVNLIKDSGRTITLTLGPNGRNVSFFFWEMELYCLFSRGAKCSKWYASSNDQ